jgi:hypothetical protein
MVDRFCEVCDVEHSVLTLGVHANLSHAWPDVGHRSPIRRIETALREAEFVAGAATREVGKRADVGER